jgi:hypothetical protein
METRSMSAISLSPDIVDLAEVSRVEITIASPGHSRKLQAGDTFTLDIDLADGRILTLPTQVTVTSATLCTADFLIRQGINSSQLMIVYQGVPATFRLEDSISVDPVLQAPSALRVNRVTVLFPAEGWFGGVVGDIAYWSMAHLPF